MSRSLNYILYRTIRLIPAVDLYSVTCDGCRYFIATDTFSFSFSQKNRHAIRPSVAQPELWLRNARSSSGDPFVQQKTKQVRISEKFTSFYIAFFVSFSRCCLFSGG